VIKMIRREPFGGIIFDENSYKIYKLDIPSFRAIELFAQKMNLERIYQTLREEFEIFFKVDDLKKFLMSIIKNFEQDIIFKRRGFNTGEIWNQKWEGTYLSSPVLVYWTFTNLCNLSCTHCAWNSGKALPSELDAEECKKIIVSGEGVEIIGMLEIFAEKFKIPCEIADPLRGIHHEGIEVPGYKLAIAIGLALSKLSKEKIGVNLLPPDERTVEPLRGMEVLKATFPIYAVGITLAIILAIFFSMEHREFQLKEDVETMEITGQILKKRVAMVKDVMKKEKGIKMKLGIIEELSKDKYLRVGLLDELNKLITPNTWFTYLKEEKTDSLGLHLVLRGVTTSNLSVSSFMKRMQESQYFRNVNLSYTQMKEINEIETTEFEIKGIFQNRRENG